MSTPNDTLGYYSVGHFGDPNDDSLYAVCGREDGRWKSGPMSYLDADDLRNYMNAAFRECQKLAKAEMDRQLEIAARERGLNAVEVSRLQGENASLRAEIERLTAERVGAKQVEGGAA